VVVVDLSIGAVLTAVFFPFLDWQLGNKVELRQWCRSHSVIQRAVFASRMLRWLHLCPGQGGW